MEHLNYITKNLDRLPKTRQTIREAKKLNNKKMLLTSSGSINQIKKEIEDNKNKNPHDTEATK